MQPVIKCDNWLLNVHTDRLTWDQRRLISKQEDRQRNVVTYDPTKIRMQKWASDMNVAAAMALQDIWSLSLLYALPPRFCLWLWFSKLVQTWICSGFQPGRTSAHLQVDAGRWGHSEGIKISEVLMFYSLSIIRTELTNTRTETCLEGSTECKFDNTHPCWETCQEVQVNLRFVTRFLTMHVASLP